MLHMHKDLNDIYLQNEVYFNIDNNLVIGSKFKLTILRKFVETDLI